jgi:hypothetical protein
LSKDQQTNAVRVANVAEADFERQIESDDQGAHSVFN